MPEEIITVDPKGMARARAVAQLHLGDPSWANMIVRAYLDPHDYNAEEAFSDLLKDE